MNKANKAVLAYPLSAGGYLLLNNASDTTDNATLIIAIT